jgi:hypothetical protein
MIDYDWVKAGVKKTSGFSSKSDLITRPN